MERIFGSCRVSTKNQNIDRQERNILARYPTAIIYKDFFTGTKITGRTGLEKILSQVESGDTIVFDSVSRMSRNAEEGIALYMQLYEQGINLVFLNEPHINSDIYHQALQNGIENVGNAIADIYINATNEVLKLLAKRQIELAFEQAQKEVDDLRERTRQGLETARRAGKRIGQQSGRKLNVKKKAPAQQLILKHSKDFNGTLTDIEVIRLAGLSRATYYKYKAELRSNMSRVTGGIDMANCVGIDFENHNYKLQHIVSDTDGNSIVKTSEIIFWIIFDMNTEILHIPITEFDIKTNTRLTAPQIVKFYSDCNRRLVCKDSKGVSVIPAGGIAKDA